MTEGLGRVTRTWYRQFLDSLVYIGMLRSPGWSDSSPEMTLSRTYCVNVDKSLPFSGTWRGFDPRGEEIKDCHFQIHTQPPSARREPGQLRRPADGAADSVLVVKSAPPWGL